MTLHVWEMANNHCGSVEHAKLIIDRFAEIKSDYKLKAGIKIQLRQLESFIHKDFQDSDLKYVKRFKSTRLRMEQFREILDHARSHGFITVATPFDNESLPWIEELGIDIIKIASCSVDDWPLLNEVSDVNKRLIISTAGAKMSHLRSVRSLMESKGREFAFMHCVGQYPTPLEDSNLGRIDELRSEFPRVEIGISTHEAPSRVSIVPYAVAKGCTIVEKHVDVETDDHIPNGYSIGPDCMAELLKEVRVVERACAPPQSLQMERESLLRLKRGVYTRKTVRAGEVIRDGDFYFAMPCQEGQIHAGQLHRLVGKVLDGDLKRDEPVAFDHIHRMWISEAAKAHVNSALKLLDEFKIPWVVDDQLELSAHYGMDNFATTGALIIDKVNREYCKKLIIMLPDQLHPTHHHVKKEETFELIGGDCTLVLNDKIVSMQRGRPVLISRGVRHSFSSRRGCVIEEVSTTHYPGDSVYDDPEINKLPLSDRKIRARLARTKG